MACWQVWAIQMILSHFTFLQDCLMSRIPRAGEDITYGLGQDSISVLPAIMALAGWCNSTQTFWGRCLVESPFFFFPGFWFFFNLFQSSFPMTFNCQWKKFTQVIPVCSQDQKPLRTWSRMFHFPFFDFISQSPLKITLHDHVKKVAFYSSLSDKVQIAKTPGSFSKLNIKLSLNQQFYQMNTGIQTKTYTWVWYCDL